MNIDFFDIFENDLESSCPPSIGGYDNLDGMLLIERNVESVNKILIESFVQLYENVKHGDDDHQKWLEDKMIETLHSITGLKLDTLKK